MNDFRPRNNFTVCSSAFGILGIDFRNQFDFLLGDAFLRNTVTSFVNSLSYRSAVLTDILSFYYGDFNANISAVIKSPSVKLVPISNGIDADYSDFLTRRRQKLASSAPELTKAQLQQLVSETQSNSSDASAANELVSSGDGSDGSYQALLDKLDAFAPAVFGLLSAIVVVLLGLLGVGVTLCVRRGRTVGAGRIRGPLYSPVPVRFKEPETEYKDEENVRYHQQ